MVSFNHGAFVEDALNSILAQTLGDLSLCIVDNASRDHSVQTISSWVEKNKESFAHVHVHYSAVNLGAAGAINYAMNYFDGKVDYVGFAASDDVAENERLEKMLNALEMHPEASVAFAEASVMDGDGKKATMQHKGVDFALLGEFIASYRNFEYEQYQRRGLDYGELLQGNCLSGIGQMWRVSDWLRHIKKLDTIIEDWENYLIAARSGLKMIWLDEVLSKYRLSVSMERYANKGVMMQRAAIEVLQREITWINGHVHGAEKKFLIKQAKKGMVDAFCLEQYLLNDRFDYLLKVFIRQSLWMSKNAIKSTVRSVLVKLKIMKPVGVVWKE